MTDPVLVRAVALGAPVLAVVLLCAWRRPSDRELAAAITSTAWALLLLLPVNLAAPVAGWWEFQVEGAAWRGVPVDLWIAWALWWGGVPALALRAPPGRGATTAPAARRSGGPSAGRVLLAGAMLVWLDLAVMPRGEPVLVLHDAWLVGEGVAVATSLVPALMLTRWTLGRARVGARAWAQALWAGGLMLALPVVVLVPVPFRPTVLTSFGLQLVLVGCLPGLAAMRELARVGGGTPLPYDPPSRLVTSGPYAYLRNPMQTSVAAAYVGLAITLGVPHLLVGALVAVAYGAGLAQWHEGEQLRRRFGHRWLDYRGAVRSWLPRWRPAATHPDAVLYVAADCDLCTGVGGWFSARETTALELRPAAEHPDLLYRVRYESAGVRADGVAAIARALGHVHLGLALVGWVLDLPGIRHFAQLCADAFGAGPRPSRPRPVACAAPQVRVDVRRRLPAARPRRS